MEAQQRRTSPIKMPLLFHVFPLRERVLLLGRRKMADVVYLERNRDAAMDKWQRVGEAGEVERCAQHGMFSQQLPHRCLKAGDIERGFQMISADVVIHAGGRIILAMEEHASL